MNRREAIAALVSMPSIAQIQVAYVRPEDVIVVECNERLTHAVSEGIRATLERVWPGRKIVVCDAGVRIRIARETP
jgi:hypothetical protein